MVSLSIFDFSATFSSSSPPSISSLSSEFGSVMVPSTSWSFLGCDCAAHSDCSRYSEGLDEKISGVGKGRRSTNGGSGCMSTYCGSGEPYFSKNNYILP